MTLDEHIKKAEEDALQAESDSDWGFGNYFIDRSEAINYAKNCRQLAEWLKDYKRLLAERRRGEWIEFTKVIFVFCIPEPYNRREQAWKCSKCGYDDGWLEWNFCPHCGADMRPEEEVKE